MWGADDPDDRKPMLWKDLTYENEESHPVKGKSRPADPNVFDPELFSFYQQLIRLKKENSALREGIFSVLADVSSGDLFGFMRKNGEQTAVCLFNRDPETRTLALDFSRFSSAVFTDAMSGETVELDGFQGTIDVPGNGFRILILTR
jgi:glycosidase